MAESGPRVVAELGRPETPEETASRKAEASRTYRSSQTLRNLLAALLVTLAVVAVVIFAVPRGERAAPDEIDVAALAQDVASGYERTVIVPDVPEQWRVNAASIDGEAELAWTIVFVPGGTGYLRVAQGFDVDEDWDARVLEGAESDGEVTVEGIVWTRYRIADPDRSGNITYALGTDAGPDRLLIYGSTDAATAAVAAAGVADQIRELREETP